MEKNIISEISRIQNLMGIKEQLTKWGWLDNTIGTFDNFTNTLAKFRNKGVPITDSEIDEFVDALKKSGNISDNEVNELLTLFKNNKDVRKILSSTDDFLGDMKKIYQLSEPPSLAIMRKLSKLTGSQMDIIMDDVLKSIQKSITTAGTNLNKTYNSFVTNFVNSLQKIIDNKEIINSVDDIYNSIDDRIIVWLNGNISGGKLNLKDAEQFYESYSKELRSNPTIAAKIEELRVAGLLESNPPKIQRPSKLSGYTPKNNPGSDLLKSAKSTNADGTVKVKFDETTEPVVDDTYQDDYIQGLIDEVNSSGGFEEVELSNVNPDEVIVDKIDPNFFNEYGGDIDFKFLEAAQWLKKTADNTKNKTLKKILVILKKGKKLKGKDFEKIEEELKTLLGSRYNILTERLLSPKFTKLNLLQSFYWKSIEPLVRKYREAYTPSYFEFVAKKSGLSGANFDFYFNNFKSRLETYIVTFDPKKANIGELRKLKDDFLRLRSAGVETNMYYEKLWSDLNSYIEKNLDASLKEDWNDILKKIAIEKGSNWRYLTWKEITKDPNLIKLAENASVGSKTGSFSPGQIVEDIVKKVSKVFWSNYGDNVVSYFMSGSIRSPKQMQEFLIKNGYAQSGMNGMFNLSAGGANFLTTQLWRYVYLPMTIAGISTVVNLRAEMSAETDIDQQPFYEHFFDSLWDNMSTINWFNNRLVDEDFEKYAPEWYSWFKNVMKFTPPAANIIYTTTASAFAKYPTPEERAHDYVDSIVSEIEQTLPADNKISKETLDIWKKAILGPMVKDVSIYNLPKETADNVVANMVSVVSVDPLLKNEIHTYISELSKKGTVTDKLSTLKEINAKYKDRIVGSAVTDIIVKTPTKTYKLIDSKNGNYSDNKGKKLNGIVYVTPDYKTLKKGDLNRKIEYHPLNELKF
jgi:hypothetical protein